MAGKIIKSVAEKIKISCCVFTLLTVLYGSIGFFLLALDSFTPKAIFVNLIIAFITGFGSYIFAIPRINYASKHILFFIINYSAFIILQGIVVNSANTPVQIFILSIFLLLVYGVILAVYFLIKRAFANAENKKSGYENQFKFKK